MNASTRTIAVTLSALAAMHAVAHGRQPAQTTGPAFDVVSVKRSITEPGRDYVSGVFPRPDGGVRAMNARASQLIAFAYAPIIPLNMRGLPDWDSRERYDVTATASMPEATRDERAAMMRAMLADRFKLAAHIEQQGEAVYDLVLARSDRRLGPGLTSIDVDCGAIIAERAAESPASRPPPDLTAPPPQCTTRTVGAPLRDRSGDRLGRLGDLLEGEGTMDSLASAFRLNTRRRVVNKTGLTGSYRVKMNFDMGFAIRPPGAEAPAGIPSIFTAVQEQLGLKLESSHASDDMLVIDHLEHPSEN